MSPLLILSRCIQHILNKYPVASRRIVHQHMGHSTNKLPILDDGTSAHE